MKELSIEEKAKRYDEAIKKAKYYYDEGKTLGYAIDIVSNIFPELKESEDERMIQYFKDLAPFDKADELYEKYGFSHKDAIAWLEKHGGHANFRNKIQIGDKVTRNEDGVLVNLSQLKRVAKPADEKQGEKPNNVYDKELSEILGRVIRRYINDPNIPYTEREKVSMEIIPYVERLEKQCENISLPKFTFDDVLALQCCMETAKKVTEDKELYEKLQSLHNRLHDAYWIEKQGEQKPTDKNPAWSEEDEKILSDIIKDLVHPWNEYIPDRIEDEIKWLKNRLKSLKERYTWKPSDEQVKAVKEAACYSSVFSEKTIDNLISLSKQLKTLREE